MSELSVLQIKSEEEGDCATGIFFPDASLGDERLIPGSGLLVLELEDDGEIFYTAAESIFLEPNTEGEPAFDRPIPLTIATTRLSVVETVFPSGIVMQLLDDEEFHSKVKSRLNGGGEVMYFQLQRAILKPVSVVRRSLNKICRGIPALKEYLDRYEVFQIEWGNQKVQLIKVNKRRGLNCKLINLQEKYYLPSPQQNVAFGLVLPQSRKKKKHSWNDIDTIFIATNNPDALQKSFDGADVHIIDDEQAEDMRVKMGLSADCPIFIIRGVTVRNGFITTSAYKKDIRDDWERYKTDFSNFL